MAGTQQGAVPNHHHPKAYDAVRNAAARATLTRSLTWLEGADVFDFLHRMSTNDISSMKNGEARRTVVVNEKGRVIDVVTVIRTGDRAILLGSPGLGTELVRWFDKFIIMDDVRIAGGTDDTRIHAIYGPKSSGIAQGLAGGAIAVPEDLGSIPGFLLVPSADARPAAVVGTRPLASADLPEIDATMLETARIEEMVPATGRELGPEVNALEAGLKRYISFSKGCYIGQEVIARLDTYRKLQNVLSLFLFPECNGGEVAPGALLHAGEEAGRITSTASSPMHGAWIGLGYRRIRLRDAAFQFLPEDGSAQIPCRCITALPEGYDEYEIQE